MSDPTSTTRYQCLSRDNSRCVRCGKELWNQQMSLHHRRLRSHPFTGLHETSNLIDLCGSGSTGCHGYVHEHPREARENGWLVSAYVDHPENIPVTYPDGKKYLLDDNGNKTLYK